MSYSNNPNMGAVSCPPRFVAMHINKHNIIGALTNRKPALKVLLVLILIPGILATAWLGYEYVKQEEEQIETELLRTARALTQAVDRDHASAISALQALATSPYLQAGDFASFHQQAARFLELHTVDNIVLTAPDGQQLVNLRRPYGDPLPKMGSPEMIRAVLQSRKPVVSNLFHGIVINRLIVATGVPVFRNDEVAYVLSMSHNPEHFRKVLMNQKFPQGWMSAIFDSTGTIVTRTKEPERYTGRKGTADTLKALETHSEGSLRTFSAEGIDVVRAYHRSSLSHWAVVISIPTSVLYAGLWQSMIMLALSLLAMTGLSIALAWFFGGYIVDSLRQLGAAVHRAMTGEAPASLSVEGPREIADLAVDFEHMLRARNEAEAALRGSEHLYRSLFENMLNGFAYCRMIYDGDRPVDYIFLSVNPAFETLTGLRDVAGRKVSEVTPGIQESDPELLEIFGRVARTGKPESFEIYVNTLAQWFSISVYSPEANHFAPVFEIITERKEHQARIARLMRLYAVLSGINSTIVRVHERQALLETACRVAFEQGQFGMAWIGLVTADGTMLRPVAGCGIDITSIGNIPVGVGGEVPSGSGAACEALQSGRGVYCNDVNADPEIGPIRQKAREHGYRSVCALPLVVDGKGIGVMGLYARESNYFDAQEIRLLDELSTDISFALQYIEREERLDYLAYYDALTGLPNRTLFLDRLTQFIHSAGHGHHSVATILLDLDRFTHINETYGRQVGDALLKRVAERLQTEVREPCSLARLGPDSFAIAVSNLARGPEAASMVRQRIFDAMNMPFVLGDVDVRVTAHAGIVLYPGDGDDAQTLLQNAEAALKEAQSSGARCLYYAAEINQRIAASLTLERELRIALDADQFVLHFQPRIELSSGRIVGAEALIRWQHPQRGLVSPAEFIPGAEQNGLIVPIGAWVIDTVCSHLAHWREQGIGIVPVAVNLSSAQFAHGDVLEVVQAALSKHKVSAHHLELELTESLVMKNPEDAARTMKEFRACGLRLALDDFGTGYSSLAYLRHFPFDFVKIDKAFITDITRNPGDAAIATAVIAMAHRLDLKVVAEGVETEGQLSYLRELDCDQVQGYFFSRPVPAEAFTSLLKDTAVLGMCATADESE
ncbi:MAG TPA: EAL domain-containing protein [Noviherbaspirillum sp.]